ncbi:MAG: baseplate J/gp47 family protein [Bacteroidota bacterium]|nr:baseplate J/gp47 family protein [Bacteroidota bacterium]
MFEDKRFEQILDRMLARVPNNLDKREGSVIWDALAPAAKELEDMYFALDAIMQETFADTASREYLIRRASERGLKPYPATKAVLKGVFDIRIPLGGRFNLDELNYVAIKFIQHNSGTNLYEYEMQCETAGKIGNGKIGNLIPIEYVNGLGRAEITELLIPAKDEETTEDLRQRYFDSFNVKAYGGNISDYKLKVHQIEGVGAVKVTPIWNGGGTVLLTILGSDFNQASPTLIKKVQDVIDPAKDARGIGVAPIGHIVTVQGTNNIAVNIRTTLTFEPNFNWLLVKPKVEEVLKEYLSELRKTWALKNEIQSNNLVVRIARIESKILNINGILDIQNTTINGSSNNLQLTEYQIPVWGGITV